MNAIGKARAAMRAYTEAIAAQDAARLDAKKARLVAAVARVRLREAKRALRMAGGRP